ncbi:MAG: hypothetical protein H0U67_08665 [Gemmatimonadetes bacterium]|nr:hypothetical protein [Gemmatimonadota bacterium]
MNYIDTFIHVAADCPVTSGVVPTMRGKKKPEHLIQYELISRNPYVHTQEDVLWETHVMHKDLPANEVTPDQRQAFLSRPQPCLRTSALPKKYGWGFHFDREGKVALHAMESEEYRRFIEPGSGGPALLPAMRSKRA